MKWSIQQLRKIQTFPYHFEEKIDFSTFYNQIDDILFMDVASVSGDIYRIDDDTYRFVYSFSVKMELQCALTLEPVPYSMEKEYDEVYSLNESEDVFLIEKNTIDLTEMVWTNILIEKPINVTLPNAYEILKERNIDLDDTGNFDDEEILFYSDGLEKNKN
jgi:hypothetical protein